jgi:hypothetical protein
MTKRLDYSLWEDAGCQLLTTRRRFNDLPHNRVRDEVFRDNGVQLGSL